MEEVYEVVESAIDYAFSGKMNLKFYEYLKASKIKQSEVDEFIESSTASAINEIVNDLEEYLVGGQDNEHKQLREGYGHIPKPQARKIKDYLHKIIEDAWRYKHDRRPGRRKKQSK